MYYVKDGPLKVKSTSPTLYPLGRLRALECPRMPTLAARGMVSGNSVGIFSGNFVGRHSWSLKL